MFTPQMTLLPSIFLKENSISTSTRESKAIVLLASPFATIKDSIRLFLSNISYVDDVPRNSGTDIMEETFL